MSKISENNENLEKVTLNRNKNVKKPFLSNEVAIFYIPRSVTLKPRSSVEIDMRVIINHADYLIPEYDLLPSFKTHLSLILPENKVNGDTLKFTLMNRSFSKTHRIPKNTGLVSFRTLNIGVNLYYNSKYITNT